MDLLTSRCGCGAIVRLPNFKARASSARCDACARGDVINRLARSFGTNHDAPKPPAPDKASDHKAPAGNLDQIASGWFKAPVPSAPNTFHMQRIRGVWVLVERLPDGDFYHLHPASRLADAIFAFLSKLGQRPNGYEVHVRSMAKVTAHLDSLGNAVLIATRPDGKQFGISYERTRSASKRPVDRWQARQRRALIRACAFQSLAKKMAQAEGRAPLESLEAAARAVPGVRLASLNLLDSEEQRAFNRHLDALRNR